MATFQLFIQSGRAKELSAPLYFRTVQRTHTNKDPLIYVATSPHTDVFELAILTTVTSESTSNVLPDDGVTAPKHVGAVLNFRRRIKSRLPFAGIIRRLSYSTRFQDKG